MLYFCRVDYSTYYNNNNGIFQMKQLSILMLSLIQFEFEELLLVINSFIINK